MGAASVPPNGPALLAQVSVVLAEGAAEAECAELLATGREKQEGERTRGVSSEFRGVRTVQAMATSSWTPVFFF